MGASTISTSRQRGTKDSGASTPDRDLRSPTSEQETLAESLEHLSLATNNPSSHLSMETAPPPSTSNLSRLHPVLCMLLQTPPQDSLIVTTRRQRELAQSRIKVDLSYKQTSR